MNERAKMETADRQDATDLSDLSSSLRFSLVFELFFVSSAFRDQPLRGGRARIRPLARPGAQLGPRRAHVPVVPGIEL